MKKIVTLILICVYCVCTVSMNVLADYYGAYHQTAYLQLERLDIVRNCKDKWKADDFIKRRDFLEMAYIVKTASRELGDFYDKQDRFQERKKSYYEAWYRFDGFSDVEDNSYDDYLTYTLVYLSLFEGKELEDGNRIVALDDYLTYKEMISIIGRLFYDEILYLNEYKDLKGLPLSDVYYELLCRKGVINSENDIYSIKVDNTMMNKNVPAYTALGLVYKSLYTPTAINGYVVINGYYYINKFIGGSEKLEIEEGTVGIDH